MRQKLRDGLRFVLRCLWMFLRHPIKTTGKVVGKIAAFMTDYRKYVSAYNGAALTYYLIILIVPAVTVIALVANLFNIDLTIVRNLLQEFLTQEYAEMIVGILSSSKISLGSIVILCLSVYAVSRGVGNIYLVTKDMFPKDEIDNESILGYYAYTIRITLFIFIAAIGIIFVVALGPVAKAFNVFYGYIVLRACLLFLMLTGFFTFLYLMIPRAPVKPSEAFKGGLVAVVGFHILSYVLNIYLAHANFSNVYGPLASVVMILFILEWGCKVFYIGLYVTHLFYMDRFNKKIQRVVIERIDHHGMGVATAYGKPTFLRNALTGEEVEIVVEKEKRKEVLAEVTDIVTPSVVRDVPICMQADTCKDCQLQYMNYWYQLTHKHYEIMRALQKYTSFDSSDEVIQPVMPANEVTRYKQFVSFPIYDYDGDLYIGENDGRTCTFMTECIMLDPMITDIIRPIQDLMNATGCQAFHRPSSHGLRQIIIKKIEDKLIVIFVTGRDGLPDALVQGIKDIPEVNGLYYTINIGINPTRYEKGIHKVYGDEFYTYHYQGRDYRISPGSYVFVSREMEDNCLQLMKDLLSPDDYILSCFCKSAILELEIPNDVVAIDENESNVKDAIHNARRLGLTNKTFIHNRVDSEVNLQIQRHPFNCAIVNLHTRMWSSVMSQTFFRSGVKNLYVLSDDPHVLCQSLFSNDTKRIQSTYDLKEVYGIDVEPYTAHVQAIFHFVRKPDV